MNWEAIGAIGETLGAVGVIVTLAYLASQMKQNTRALRSGSLHTYRTESVAMHEVREKHGEVFAKAGRGDELTERDRQIFASYSYRLFGLMETVFLNYNDGSVSKEVFEGRMKGFKQAMNNELIGSSWDTWKRFDFTDTFIEYVESEILGSDA